MSGSHGCEYEDVFWDVAPCSLVEVYRRFRGACCLHHQAMSTHVGKLLTDHTAQHPRKQSSSENTLFICMSTQEWKGGNQWRMLRFGK
jgi:hypothetical protein